MDLFFDFLKAKNETQRQALDWKTINLIFVLLRLLICFLNGKMIWRPIPFIAFAKKQQKISIAIKTYFPFLWNFNFNLYFESNYKNKWLKTALSEFLQTKFDIYSKVNEKLFQFTEISFTFLKIKWLSSNIYMKFYSLLLLCFYFHWFIIFISGMNSIFDVFLCLQRTHKKWRMKENHKGLTLIKNKEKITAWRKDRKFRMDFKNSWCHFKIEV